MQPGPQGVDKGISVMKVILGLLDPKRRLMARAAIGKGKMESVGVHVGESKV